MEKGFDVSTGFMGWIPWKHQYMLFASEQDYEEFLEAHE